MQHPLTPEGPVKGLREIVSIPTDLTSRSLIFAYGIDIFFTHATYSQTQHSPAKFNILLLLLITIIAAFVSRMLLHHRRFDKAGKRG